MYCELLANHQIDIDIRRHIGLDRQGAHIVGQLFRSSPSHSWAAIVTGLAFAAAGTAAVASSLQMIYERIFGQPHRGWKGAFSALLHGSAFSSVSSSRIA